MSYFYGLVAVLIVISLIVWLFIIYKVIRNVSFFRILEDCQEKKLNHCPKVSVLIPARNEETTVEVALQTVLNQDYPNYEVIFVNDRSTDQTGEIATKLSLDDPRLKVIHVKELPEGWLGKLHAMELAKREATGDWLLFTDADIHLAPNTLRKSVDICCAENIDHLTLLPEPLKAYNFRFFVLNFILASIYFFFYKIDLRKIGVPGSNIFVGLGAFNLVRTETFLKTKGFEWIKMEISDDFALAQMLYEVGAKSACLGGRNIVSLVWRTDWKSLMKATEKDFDDFAYDYASLLKTVIFSFLIITGLLIAIIIPPYEGLRVAGLLTYLALSFSAILVFKKTNYPLWGSFCIPLGFFIVSCTLLRSAFKCWKQGGIVWRATFYPVEELRKMVRVRFGKN